MQRLGIVDWGVGGLGFYRLLKQRFPMTSVDYLSDSGSVPYGKLSARALRERVEVVMNYFAGRGVNRVVVACNAASTALPRYLAGPLHGSTALRTTGIVDHAVRAVRRVEPDTLGVIGGVRTIRSGVYRRALSGSVPRIMQRIAQPLSGFIEAGELRSERVTDELTRVLRPLRSIDTLLLACTHYPALHDQIASELPGVTIVDPAVEMLDWVAENWLASMKLSNSGSSDLFATTGRADAMEFAARRAFGVELDAVVTTGL